MDKRVKNQEFRGGGGVGVTDFGVQEVLRVDGSWIGTKIIITFVHRGSFISLINLQAHGGPLAPAAVVVIEGRRRNVRPNICNYSRAVAFLKYTHSLAGWLVADGNDDELRYRTG